ncbi:TBC domain-containing protein [Toxoplasma gondii RUB]|uniref:TBC domain-containing protein n=9 Tax=Toxoplasma gondii TaxID=5811 RepID=S7UQW4_TOXGG|nr:TBC domain-containing protein [Toxoplasma gondii GT1]KAF4639956.1 TBC domain-containing protein [Toxoplasma gondii]KFG27892.1 TBC domain-containing protein [Toxoplasma gondii p89]KFG32358.1 TBC domain-containing protein [Toxoplasma gondii FOU]KFG57156.1 TBC domain-containing protein [Toxoplasma gondii RUB]KFH00961.1 TBC domain-containing protein [Toxoplasma gondii MAS]KFH08056.1 TBC domain-containing protein [Toxoplasma gondii VAND]PUA83426.1 TBC domain-containing protein [Toxoplasma gond
MSSPSIFSEGGASAQSGLGSCSVDGAFLDDDDGLPPLTVSDISRLFDSHISSPLAEQARRVLATGRLDEAPPASGVCAEEFPVPSSPLLRRIVWQRYLGLLEGEEASEWAAQVEVNRKKYFQLREEQKLSTKRLTALDPQKFHPLAATADNPWSQKQQNDSLMEEIWKDVERTFADRALFCRDATRKALQRILFTWSRQNPDVSYKQGMNELLAILFLICVREQVPVFSADTLSENVATHVRVLLSAEPTDIEADAFSLFNALMNDFLMRAAYIPPPTPPKPVASPMVNILGKGPGEALGGLVGVASSAPQTQQSAVLWRCSHIFHSLLRKSDTALYDHLVEMDVQPQLFLLRWLRLLFSREFHVQDTIFIWDAIFADAYLRNGIAPSSSNSKSSLNSTPSSTAVLSAPSPSCSGVSLTQGTDLMSSSRLSAACGTSPLGQGSSSSPSYVPEKLGAAASSRLPLTDFFALAMLMFVRENLLASDETSCLRRLLKFPPIESLQSLILLALSLRTPQKPRENALSKRHSAASSSRPASFLEDESHKSPPQRISPASFEEGRETRTHGSGLQKGSHSLPSPIRIRHSPSSEAPHSFSASSPVPSFNARALPPARGDLYHVTTPQVETACPPLIAGHGVVPHHLHQTQAKRQPSPGREEGGRSENNALPRVAVAVGQRAETNIGENTVDGLSLGRHVEDIVATLKAAALSEAAVEAGGIQSGRPSSSASCPLGSRPFTQLALSSAISRLSLLQRMLVGELPYSPSLFMVEEEAFTSASSPVRTLAATERPSQFSRASQLPSGSTSGNTPDGCVFDEERRPQYSVARAERQHSEKRIDAERTDSEEIRIMHDEGFFGGRDGGQEAEVRMYDKHGIREIDTRVTRGRNGQEDKEKKGTSFFSPSSLPVVGDSSFARSNHQHNLGYSRDDGVEVGSHDGRGSGGIRATVL